MSFVDFDIERFYDEQLNRQSNESSVCRRRRKRLCWCYVFAFFFFPNSYKCLLLIVSMFFFSFFVVIFSITSDFESFFLSVSVEKAIQKIFRAENVIETNVFAAIVFDFLQIISSNEIAISNRNAEKKFQNEQVFSAKKNSNDVERQHSDAVSSSSSFDVSKSNDQKNLDSSVDFSALLIEQRTTTFIRI